MLTICQVYIGHATPAVGAGGGGGADRWTRSWRPQILLRTGVWAANRTADERRRHGPRLTTRHACKAAAAGSRPASD